ncbi:MAG: hypothetical protein Q7U18_05700 [Methylobacter sp.]|nr:hypothetical protein [Methylobacter sp.]
MTLVSIISDGYCREQRVPAAGAKRFSIEPVEGAAMTLAERAYTSPIWHPCGQVARFLS